MMLKAKGPVWHKKYKEKGIVPEGLRGLDKEATWSRAKSDGWVYGHGTFSLATHKIPVLGCFVWMRNSKNEAKKMWLEIGNYTGLLDFVVMDSKADDYSLFRELKRQRKITLLTTCRKNKNKTSKRKEMIATMRIPEHRCLIKERSWKIEPMQGLVAEIFELIRCWMRGDANNRWLFAAMGLAVQMHQLKAYREGESTWKIKSKVLGFG